MSSTSKIHALALYLYLEKRKSLLTLCGILCLGIHTSFSKFFFSKWVTGTRLHDICIRCGKPRLLPQSNHIQFPKIPKGKLLSQQTARQANKKKYSPLDYLIRQLANLHSIPKGPRRSLSCKAGAKLEM
jgi:hypothetical protein